MLDGIAYRHWMSVINYVTNDIFCKIVYVGPEGSGKTANLDYIYGRTNPSPSAPFTNKDGSARTFFELLPLRLGRIRGFATHFHLFAIPGASDYSQTRSQIILNPMPKYPGIPEEFKIWCDPRMPGTADGFVFVADARGSRLGANVEALSELRATLKSAGVALAKIPFVLQRTFADAGDALPPEELAARLLDRNLDIPIVTADPPTGTGIFDTLKVISKLVLTELKKG